jgi:hypothetical protein
MGDLTPKTILDFLEPKSHFTYLQIKLLNFSNLLKLFADDFKY